MSDIGDEIVDGYRCMKCTDLLVGEDGSLCDAGHPVFCHECWRKLPKKDREEGAPFFDEESSSVCNGEEGAA